MDNIRPADKTATLGLDQGYRPLHITRVTEGGHLMMKSLWRPSTDELAALQNGAVVCLRVLGAGHPPVRLDVEEAGHG